MTKHGRTKRKKVLGVMVGVIVLGFLRWWYLGSMTAQTYKDANLGFEVKSPTDWQVKKTEDGLGVDISHQGAYVEIISEDIGDFKTAKEYLGFLTKQQDNPKTFAIPGPPAYKGLPTRNFVPGAIEVKGMATFERDGFEYWVVNAGKWYEVLGIRSVGWWEKVQFERGVGIILGSFKFL